MRDHDWCDAAKEVERLRAQVKMLEDLAEADKREVGRLRDERAGQEAGREYVRDLHAEVERLRASNIDLEQKLTDEENENERLRATNVDLEGKYNVLASEVERLREELEMRTSFAAEAARLQAELDRQGTELNRAQGELSAALEEVERLRHEVRHHSPDMKSCSCGAVSAERYQDAKREAERLRGTNPGPGDPYP